MTKLNENSMFGRIFNENPGTFHDIVVKRFNTSNVIEEPGGSGHGERANLTGLVIGCIVANFCNLIFVGKLSPRPTQ